MFDSEPNEQHSPIARHVRFDSRTGDDGGRPLDEMSDLDNEDSRIVS